MLVYACTYLRISASTYLRIYVSPYIYASTHVRMYVSTYARMHACVFAWIMHAWVGGWVAGWLAGWLDGWMDGWMDVGMYACGNPPSPTSIFVADCCAELTSLSRRTSLHKMGLGFIVPLK